MGTKKRYTPILSPQKIEEIDEQLHSRMKSLSERERKRINKLREMLHKKGEERFLYTINLMLQGPPIFSPTNPDYNPELKEDLDNLRKRGYPVDNIKVSTVGDMIFKSKSNKLRIEIPFDANIKEYLPAIEVYRKFLDPGTPKNFLQGYLADEHDRGMRTYSDLAEELNEALEKWRKGEETELDIFGFDDYLRKERGYTPKHYELFDENQVMRIVKYYHTGK